jgi:hypothetical protein
MNFWHIQLHPGPANRHLFPPSKIQQILIETAYIGLGEWNEGQEQIRQFKDVLQKGDIVAVRDGQTPIALVEITGNYEYEEEPNEQLDWFEHRRKIRILDWYKNEYNFIIPRAMGTFSICSNPEAETTKNIKNWYEKFTKFSNVEKYADEIIKALGKNEKNINSWFYAEIIQQHTKLGVSEINQGVIYLLNLNLIEESKSSKSTSGAAFGLIKLTDKGREYYLKLISPPPRIISESKIDPKEEFIKKLAGEWIYIENIEPFKIIRIIIKDIFSNGHIKWVTNGAEVEQSFEVPHDWFGNWLVAEPYFIELNSSPDILIFGESKGHTIGEYIWKYNFKRGNIGENPIPQENGTKQIDTTLIPSYSTEGNHRKTEDQLDFIYDIESLASVICLRDVRPPLAIGLFGKWGAGKSFFMEKLNEQIDHNIKQKNKQYIEHVVHVKFNSWHYSDANLWASLISEIFESLSDFSKKEEKEAGLKELSDSLQITNMQREIAEQKRHELECKVKELKEKQKEKREKLEDLSGIGVLKLLLSDKKIHQDFSELENENIEEIINNAEKVGDYIREAQKFKNKLSYYLRLLVTFKGWRWGVVIFTAAIVFIGVYIIKNYFNGTWENISYMVSVIISVIASFIANAFAMIRPVKEKLNDVFKRLESLKKTINSRGQINPPELNETEKKLEQLNISIVDLDKKIKETNKEINDIVSGKKLIEFIEQRSRDESYAKQLGLISWIRKDFKKLDELLRKQNEFKDTADKKNIDGKVELKIDRMVLYIDDLDRCNEDIVVKVLESIHLLLAFELFVVVVGVDPRWLNNALNEKYKSLFGSNQFKKNLDTTFVENEHILSGAATSYDYLEKIFQIPFTLKPIDKTGREHLIEYLLRTKPKPLPTPLTLEPVGNEKAPIPIPVPVPEPILPKNELKELTYTAEELAYMQKISGIFGHTPRGINRYINIYRIIKSHKKFKVSSDFSPNEYIPTMVILAILVGYSLYAQDFITKIDEADAGITFQEFINKPNIKPEIKEVLNAYLDDGILSMKMVLFKKNLELISRFSFRTLTITT